VVPGKPKGKGRPRFGNGRAYTDQATRAAEEAWQWAWRAGGRRMVVGHFGLAVEVVHQSPKRPTAPYPKRPDLDNVVKLVADALNGMAWTDDALCQSMRATKVYGPAPMVVLEWWPIPDAGRWA